MNTQNFKALERSSTLFLKLILLVLSIGVLVFCGFLLYQITQSDALGYYRPILIGVVISTIPLLYIFYQAFNLLNNIDNDLSLTDSSVNSLRIIKVCSFLISLMYLIGSGFSKEGVRPFVDQYNFKTNVTEKTYWKRPDKFQLKWQSLDLPSCLEVGPE